VEEEREKEMKLPSAVSKEASRGMERLFYPLIHSFRPIDHLLAHWISHSTFGFPFELNEGKWRDNEMVDLL
jgi:hypothetical protein